MAILLPCTLRLHAVTQSYNSKRAVFLCSACLNNFVSQDGAGRTLLTSYASASPVRQASCGRQASKNNSYLWQNTALLKAPKRATPMEDLHQIAG